MFVSKWNEGYLQPVTGMLIKSGVPHAGNPSHCNCKDCWDRDHRDYDALDIDGDALSTVDIAVFKALGIYSDDETAERSDDYPYP